MKPEDLSIPELRKFWKEAKKQHKNHTDILEKGKWGSEVNRVVSKIDMLKDIIAESEKQFEAKYKSTFIPLFGYKNPDDGREREIIAEHAWFNFKKEVVAETAQLVAREVLREERKRITSVLEKAEPSIYDPDGNNSYDRSLKLEGYKDCFAEVWSAINPTPKYAIGIDFAKSDPHLQSLEESLNK